MLDANYSIPIKKIQHPKVADRRFTKIEKPNILPKIQQKTSMKKTREPKYITACPGMPIIHKQQIKNKNLKERFITNGKKLAPYSFHDNTYAIENTSLIDSILEILAFSHKNINDFKNYCKNISCVERYCLLKIIIDWSEKGDYKRLYSQRAEILFNNADVTNTRISIKDKLGTFLCKVFENHYSIRKTAFCNNCNRKDVKDVKILCLDDEKSIYDLQNEIKKYLILQKNSDCLSCKSSLDFVYETGPFIFIDLEESIQSKMYLNVLPDFIEFQNSKYILAGIIGFKDGNEPLYITYTRSVGGVWKEINGNADIKSKTLTKIPRVNIAMCLYINIKM